MQFYSPSSRRTWSQTLRAERRIISYSTEICRRYQNYRYILWCNAGEKSKTIGTLMEVENCQIHGQVPQDSPYWMKNHQMDVHGPGRLDKKTNDLQARHFVARDLERYVRCIETQRKAKVGDRETKARQCQKIAWCLLHWSWWWGIQGSHEKYMWKDVNSDASRNALQTVAQLNEEHETQYACIVEADESIRKRMEGSRHKNHEDHIAGKGMNSLSHYNLVHKFIPLPQAMKIPDAKAAVGITKDCKSNGYFIKTTRMRRTNSRCIISLTPRSNWKMHHHCFKFRSQNVQMFGYVYQNTNGLNHVPAWKIQSFLSKRNLYGRSFGRNIMGKAIWDSSLGTRLGKVLNWKCLFVNREDGHFFSVYVDDVKLAGKKENISPTWKILMKGVDLEEPTSFFDHVYLCCTQRECQTSEDIVDNYRNMFKSWISAGAMEKLPEAKAPGKPETNTISSWSSDMEGHAKKCVEGFCELSNKTTVIQSRNWRPPIQGRRNGICRRIVYSLLTNGSDMPVLGTSW